MDTYFLCIDEYCIDDSVLFCLEEYLKNTTNEVVIKLLVSKNKYKKVIANIILLTSFLNKGIIQEIRFINDYQIFDEDQYLDNYILKNDSIFTYKLGKDTILNVYKKVILLDDFEGIIYLKTSEATIISKRLINAKVVTLKNAKTNITMKFSIIKGDDIL